MIVGLLGSSCVSRRLVSGWAGCNYEEFAMKVFDRNMVPLGLYRKPYGDDVVNKPWSYQIDNLRYVDLYLS